MDRVVDITGDGRTLTLSHYRLVVSHHGETLGMVPLSDIQSVLVHGHGAMVSTTLLAQLAEAGIPVFVCGANHLPAVVCTPVVGHFEQAERMALQTEASRPTCKRLWKHLVVEKIRAQAAVLERTGRHDVPRLHALAQKVRSGDPENVEAQSIPRSSWVAIRTNMISKILKTYRTRVKSGQLDPS